jgi:hypothetical protein
MRYREMGTVVRSAEIKRVVNAMMRYCGVDECERMRNPD